MANNGGDAAFLDQLAINYGPFDLFSRFFLKTAQELTLRGITLEFSSFEELQNVNQQNRDSWRPLLSSFQTSLGGANADTGFVLLGRNGDGKVIATQAIRLFDWSASNLKEEAEALRIFYADPGRHRLDNEACIVEAPSADQVSGIVGLGGGVWYHPDFRGRQLGAIVPRIARCYALAHYNVDNLFALYSPLNIEKKLHSRSGYRDNCGSVTMRNSRTAPDEDLLMTLCRQQPMDIVDDTFQFLVDWGTQVDAGVGARRA